MTTLLDTLVSSLSSSPPPLSASGSLRLHTLTSVPRPVKSLYPLAHIHPTNLDACRSSSPISAYLEHIVVTASWAPQPSAPAQPPTNPTRPPPRATLIFALEAFLYTLPDHRSAVLYISKLDTTGYAPAVLPSHLRTALAGRALGPEREYGRPLTASLSSAFVQHFSTFRHWRRERAHGVDAGAGAVRHVSVHVLARSQAAYLFPGSAEHGRKTVLSDAGLVRWWRDVLSDAVVRSRRQPAGGVHSQPAETDARAYYLLPGYSRLESHVLVPLPPVAGSTSLPAVPGHAGKAQLLAEAGWVYGYPYSAEGAGTAEADLPPLPLHWQRSSSLHRGPPREAPTSPTEAAEASEDPNADGYDPKKIRCIATLMPHFPDDPKTRFLDELQRDAHEHAGWKKADRAAGGRPAETTQAHGTSEPGPSGTPNGTVSSCTDDGVDQAERYESDRPAKRTKLDVPAPAAAMGSSSSAGGPTPPLPVLRGQMRERASLDDLSVDEFWLRMGFRQECSSGNAVGVLVCLFTRPSDPAHPDRIDCTEPPTTAATTTPAPTALPLSLPHPTIQDLVVKNLMRDVCRWDVADEAVKLTRTWDANVSKAVKRKGGWIATQESGELAVRDRGEAGGTEGEEELVGKGVVWRDVWIEAPKREVVELVEREWAAARGNEEGAALAQGQRQTNVLSVKRKKKPSAAS